MATYNINKIKLPNGDIVKLVDETSGYITGISAADVTTALGFTPYNSTNPNGYTSNTGTVKSVGLSNTGGLTITGSPITTSGTISIGHTNSITSQTAQSVYSIKIDSYGHITSATAVTIPTVYNGSLYLQKNTDAATAVYTANQSTSTTLKWTTSDFKTVSSWSAGTLPTLGTAVSYTYISSWITNTPTAIDTTKFGGGSLVLSGGGSTVATAAALTYTFTPAAFQAGFCTAGSAATLTYSNSTIQPLSSVGTLPSLVSSTSTLVTGITKL